ncbi:MAG TPA: hypothetical protein DC049_13350, partial [Spirochaetia bacterium]|nr:hypothetical protein [Spirochaetia bacterium]
MTLRAERIKIYLHEKRIFIQSLYNNNQNMKLQKYYLLLGVIILILHGLYFIPADPDARIKNNIFFAGDTAEYYGLASSILAGQGMKSEQWIPVMLRDRYNNFGLNARRTPFYPLFLASIMWTSHLIAPQITHIDIYAILGIQILLMLAASLLFFRLILIITLKPKIAFIATLIISLEPCWFSLQHSIWSENLLLPIVVWHITHVFLYFSRHRKIDFIIIFLSA